MIINLIGKEVKRRWASGILQEQDLEEDEWHREMFITFPLGKGRVELGRMETEDPFRGILYWDVDDGMRFIYPLREDLEIMVSFVNLDDEDGLKDDFYSLVGSYRSLLPLEVRAGWY